MFHDVFRAATELSSSGETFALITIVSHKGSVPRHLSKMIVRKDGGRIGTIGGDCLEGQAVSLAMQKLKEGKTAALLQRFELIEEELGGSGMNCGGSVEVLIEIIEPRPQVIIAGSGNVAKSLAKIGRLLQFEVVVVDSMARKEDFPDADLVIEKKWLEEALDELHITERSYVVIVTRHKNDVPSLRAALGFPAAYIGLIGSRRRVALAFDQLSKEGIPEAEMTRVSAPVGLDIGAETAEEIALSVMAEIVQKKRLGTIQPALPLKTRSGVGLAKAVERRSDDAPPQRA